MAVFDRSSVEFCIRKNSKRMNGSNGQLGTNKIAKSNKLTLNNLSYKYSSVPLPYTILISIPMPISMYLK